MRSTARTPGRKNVVATRPRPKIDPQPSSKLLPREKRGGHAGYLALVRKRRLKRIQSDDELKEASELLDQLLSRNLTSDEQDYFDVLAELVHHYESAHVTMPKSTPAELVAFMADQHGITQAELAERLDVSEALVSAIINGKREISRSMLRKLGHVFHVSPAAFLGQAHLDHPQASEDSMTVRKKIASDAGKLLRDKKSTRREKELAASDLAQRRGANKSGKKK